MLSPLRDCLSFKRGVTWYHHITIVENRKAQLVVIAHNMDPTERVVLPPALGHKMGIPYYIIKGKASLGRLVPRKTCPMVISTQVHSEDKGAQRSWWKLSGPMTMTDTMRPAITGEATSWVHSRGRFAKLEKAKAKQLATKLGYM